MSGGPRHWNEETQRWEDPGGAAAVSPPTLPGRTTPHPMTPPTPSTPPAAPPVPPSWYDPEPGTPLPAPPLPPAPDTATWPSSPPPDPGGTPPGGGHGGRLVLTVIVGAAAAGVAVSLVLTLVIGGGGKNDARPRTTPTATTAHASPTPTTLPTSTTPTTAPGSPGSPSATPTGIATAPFQGGARLPAGYEAYQDDQGFRIARPKGWSRTTTASVFGFAVVNYRSPDRKQRLQIYQVEEASPDASFDLFLSDQTAKPAGFRSVSRENLDTADFTGTRVAWTATRIKGESDVGTWHVYDERFVAPDGKIYAIAAYGPDTGGHRTRELRNLTTALTWFCPTGATCETPQD
ncbi:hypothetical protein [Streptomyces sp. NPDC047000]|uniref:hypothetical protein n=1 Tax=Streptomyces sp. NPDC047000 TaxID=3155474 RepID=UPI0033CFCBF4